MAHQEGSVASAMAEDDDLIASLFWFLRYDDPEQHVTVTIQNLIAMKETLFDLRRIGPLAHRLSACDHGSHLFSANDMPAMLSAFDATARQQLCCVLTDTVFEADYRNVDGVQVGAAVAFMGEGKRGRAVCSIVLFRRRQVDEKAAAYYETANYTNRRL